MSWNWQKTVVTAVIVMAVGGLSYLCGERNVKRIVGYIVAVLVAVGIGRKAVPAILNKVASRWFLLIIPTLFLGGCAVDEVRLLGVQSSRTTRPVLGIIPENESAVIAPIPGPLINLPPEVYAAILDALPGLMKGWNEPVVHAIQKGREYKEEWSAALLRIRCAPEKEPE